MVVKAEKDKEWEGPNGLVPVNFLGNAREAAGSAVGTLFT